ncbi:MAG: hypothetical protein RJQ09_19375 [Cyclobacteriaceae bacterium]
MDENKKIKSRVLQLDEMVANTTRNVDRLTAEMAEFRNYCYENNKVVNDLLRKMDDREEEIKKLREDFESTNKRLEKTDLRLEKIDLRLEKLSKEQDKKWEDQHQLNIQMIRSLEKLNERLDKSL